MVFLHIKSLPNLLFGVLCLPGDQSHPFAQPTITPLACCICWAGLLGRAVFPPWNEGPNFGSLQSCSNCCFLTCIQISQEARWSGIPISWRIFHSLLWFTVKGFSIVNEADVFLGFPCFFYDLTDVGSLISGSSAFSKPSLYIWKFSVHILLKPSLKDFENYLDLTPTDVSLSTLLHLILSAWPLRSLKFMMLTLN